MLGDGKSEAPLSAADLQQLLSSIQGEKLLIVDACYSGALIGRGVSRAKPASGQPRAVARVHGNAFPRGFKHSRADLRQRI